MHGNAKSHGAGMPHFTSPGAECPPLPFALSAADAQAFEALADQLVAETLHASEDFLAQGRTVDPALWKLVLEKDNVAMYRTRKRSRCGSARRRQRALTDDDAVMVPNPQKPKLYPTNESELQELLRQQATTGRSVTHLEYDDSDDDVSSLDGFEEADSLQETKSDSERSLVEEARPASTPLVIGTGVVPGTVEDAALGFLADTDFRSKLRFSTSKELTLKDVRILAKTQGPSEDDPFRFLGVKWLSHTTSGGASLIVKPRDYLVLESTGMALDSNGERICYLLNHSIELDEVPEFRKFGLVRIKLSACHIVRAHETPGNIEIFCRGFMNSGGRISTRMSTFMLCDGLISTSYAVEEAYVKKMAWLLRTRKQRQSGSSGSYSSSVSDAELGAEAEACSCCHKPFGKGLNKLMTGSARTCRLCRQHICRKCTVKKELPLDPSLRLSVNKKGVDFCLNCYLKAKDLSAWRVAVAVLPQP